MRSNLHREARIMSQLRHPNIIRLYETLKVRVLTLPSQGVSSLQDVSPPHSKPKFLIAYFPVYCLEELVDFLIEVHKTLFPLLFRAVVILVLNDEGRLPKICL